MTRLPKIFLLICLLLPASFLDASAQQKTDSRTLGMAIDYFQSGKYHEAIVLFNKLDKEYELNPRFLAYMGVCYFYIEEYKSACKYLLQQLPKLHVFSPAEQTLYYATCAESSFILEEYAQAIDLFRQTTQLCREEEKGDCFYKIALSYSTLEQYDSAYHYLSQAKDNYRHFQGKYTTTARMAQIEKMMVGCKMKIEQKGSIPPLNLP